MRRALSILLLFFYLFSTTELHELVKLPILVEHYYHHSAVNNNESLLTFINEHYFSGDIHDEDYQQDKKLPFKSNDNCVLATTSVPVNPELFTIVKPIIFSIERNYKVEKNINFNSNYLSSIWQPPRA